MENAPQGVRGSMLDAMLSPPAALSVPAHLAPDWPSQLAQHVEELLWVWDPSTGKITYTNPAFERFWGFGADSQPGPEALLQAMHPDDRYRLRKRQASLARAAIPQYTYEYRVSKPGATPQGEQEARTTWLRERAFGVKGPDGKLRHVTHVASDVTWQLATSAQLHAEITLRTDVERALAESDGMYRAVVENVSEGILVTSGGRIKYCNPAGLALTGNDEDTALTRSFVEFIHPDDRAQVLENHTRRARGELVNARYQFRVLHKDGSVRWVEISGVPFEWENEPATLNFLTDVTERRQVELEMRNALARERELSELKSRFVAVASHEFRTPLAGILSSVELLDSYGDRLPADERQEMLTQIKLGVARMNDMVDQVLVTSRIESGKFELTPVPQHLPHLLVQITAEMDRAHPQAARIEIECEDVDEPRQCDPQLLRHILVNLLSNALKYSAPESPVICAVRGEGDGLWLRVTDHGIGIPPADLPRLFESFHRGTNVGNVQGTGIGLHIVKECVSLHRGTIEVHSRPGLGTTFHVHVHAPLV